MSELYEDHLKSARHNVAEYQLQMMVVTEKYQVGYMSPPGTRNPSTQLVFTPEGIVIMGDLCPGVNGVVSVYGKGLRWFAGRMNAGYLAEKFLQKQFNADQAVEELHVCLTERMRPWDEEPLGIDDDSIKYCMSQLGGNEIGLHQFLEEITDWGWIEDCEGHIPGWGYDLQDLALLYAIYEKFHELYWAMRDAEKV